jgi:TolB-like protein
MIYRFGEYALDTVKGEVIQPGGQGADRTAAVEPQVFALLALLIENRERLVGRDEIVERIWNGRIVSESAIDSRIRSARQAIGDDGRTQRLIRTLPKKGYRFVGAVTVDAPMRAAPAPAPIEATSPAATEPSARPSIAVLPFTLNGARDHAGSLADALAADLIAELSRLRWLFVIARGSSFRFRGENVSLDSVRDALGVRYVLTGAIETRASALAVTVELVDLIDQGVVWGERFSGAPDAVHEIRENIVRAAMSALELQIPINEARRARLKAPGNLDAWSSYHLGLHHLFQFTVDGNVRANEAFKRAIAAEPDFARAHAGLSFAHFEDAFLRFVPDRQGAIDSACAAAEKSLELDPLDPLCNLVMGRVHWLHGDLEASLPWLERAVALNPNYAQGKYSLGWTRTLLGEAHAALNDVDGATMLSPLDPLLYGMLGVRAFSHLTLGEDREAARWAVEAAHAPGAHALIALIAATMHELIGAHAEAQRWVRVAKARHSGIAAAAFMAAFPIRDETMRTRIVGALKRLDL